RRRGDEHGARERCGKIGGRARSCRLQRGREISRAGGWSAIAGARMEGRGRRVLYGWFAWRPPHGRARQLRVVRRWRGGLRKRCETVTPWRRRGDARTA